MGDDPEKLNWSWIDLIISTFFRVMGIAPPLMTNRGYSAHVVRNELLLYLNSVKGIRCYSED